MKIILPEPAKFIFKDGTIVETSELETCENEGAGLHCITCYFCGKVLQFLEEPKTFKCDLCGEEVIANSCCPSSHYLCSHCWAQTTKCHPVK